MTIIFTYFWRNIISSFNMNIILIHNNKFSQTQLSAIRGYITIAMYMKIIIPN